MRVALTAEGTYPHAFGGVSVWCDQLIRALPQYEFAVVALVSTGTEPVQWDLPAHVAQLVTVPLWGPPPPSPRARGPRGRGVPLAVRELVDVLVDDNPGERFGIVLRGLHEYARTRNLTATLASEATTQLLAGTWRERWPLLAVRRGVRPADVHPTLHDAVTAMQLVEHALRPLSHPGVQADVAHVVTNGLGALPALVAKWQNKVPMIVTEHGVYMREQYVHLRNPPFGWPTKDLYLRFLAHLCTLGYQEAEVITPGNIYNKRWEEVLGADGDRVRTIYNGVDPEAFPVLTDEPEIPTISWVGRIDPIKDLETLLNAFALVVKEMPEALLRIFGSAPRGREPYLERCRALAVELGIDGSVTFEGRVEEIRDAYAAGQVVVLCSISEGFPYSLIEAMTCGRACVATDVGGVSEALGADAGVVVPPRDPAALAEGCLMVLRDADLRKSLGAKARERALEHFTVDRAVSAFDEIYSLTGSGRSALLPGGGEQIPDEQIPDEQAPVEQAPVEQVPDEQSPVEQTPDDQATDEQASDEQIPDEQAPVEQAPVEQITHKPITHEPIPDEQITHEQAIDEQVPGEHDPDEHDPDDQVVATVGPASSGMSS
jgi:polysaccharide biosynthesis protein PelF